jgi:formamidopyrimidine-DNA glycosylase
MPELPEGETTKNDLNRKVIGLTIVGVEALWPDIVKDVPFNFFADAIKGKRIISVMRRAKNLSIGLSDGLNLLIHLKMTGHIIVTDEDDRITNEGRWASSNNRKLVDDSQNQFIRIVFHLSGNKKLALSDLRKFAYISLRITQS